MNNKLIFDAHTHFNDETYEEMGISTSEMIKTANQKGVGYFLNCSFDLASSVLAIKQANEHENMFVAVGIHPNVAIEHTPEDLNKLEALLNSPKVVAIGEIGLDYFYTKKDMDIQKEMFKKQIEIAIKHNLTIMLHIRDHKNVFDAYDDVVEILNQYPNKPNVIVHCFSANKEYAKKLVNLGFYINIGGAVTFKNAKELQEAATWIPMQNLLVETDAPYLTPHPFRGQMINKPEMIVYTVEKIAELKNLDKDFVIQQTTENAFSAFNIPKEK
ncbi:TatD family hydrolase [Williamsoniiplasma luminosum]|uniref:TatD family deoxyribonuclease n=1 Tax=Williamsoniiplasma luminosum TaxID=214888 RepID=A0A2S0NKN3_9MOLU|nr:TatD family hydrolase [Williamsoniiplasma luminosum]AVP49576.1 MAG: TatD family deoxyribonuclease [Williamsoniiplasma luminosum]